MIVCCGEALIDMVRIKTSTSEEVFLPLPGGSPYNTAIAIGRLNVPVTFLGRFSSDFFGEILIKRLRANRVGDELIKRAVQNTSLAFVKLEKGKEPRYVFYTEGTANCSLSMEDLPPALPPETRCILFGSIAMTVEPIASSIEALILREGARKSADQMDGAPVLSFDPNIRSFLITDHNAYLRRFEKWIAASTIAKISSSDFKFLYPGLQPEQALQKVIAMGPRLAICTLATKGALALLRRNDGSVTRVSVPGISLPVVDTIGAGDAFHGALLAWLEMKGKMSRSALVNLSEADLYNALLFANKAAAIVCSRRGAEPPTRKEIQSLNVPEGKAAANKPTVKKAVPEKPKAGKPAAKKATSGKPKASKPAVKKATTKTATAAPTKKATAAKTTVKKPAVKKRG